MKKIESTFTTIPLIFSFLLFFITSPGFADSERALKKKKGNYSHKFALVIGNSSYASNPLKNPVNDARDMGAVLREIGFNVILETDASQRKMENAIRKFGNKLKHGGVGFFYYAGHGLQINGRNYLIPVGAYIESESDVKYEAVDAGFILGKMEDAGNDLNIVILDACRNNPFARSYRSSDRGLAKMDAPRGSIIAYATSPGSVAADGTGKNGLYTSYLIKNIKRPGLTIEQVLKRVRVSVASETKYNQVPWESSSLMGNFYFIPDGSSKPKLEVSEGSSHKVDSEEEMWLLVRDTKNINDLNYFLETYPNGNFNKHAMLKRNQLLNLSKGKKEEKLKFKDEYEFTDLRFFESGKDAPEPSKREYKTKFNKSTTRYINFEVKVKNLLYKEKDHDHKVKFVVYNPDNSIRTTLTSGFYIKQEWLNSWAFEGWGHENKGSWPIGKYRVKAYIDEKKIAEKIFEVTHELKNYKLTNIRFFEAGPKAPGPDDRVFKNSFEKSDSRYIYCQVNIKNLNHKKSDQTLKMKWVYYNPDGKIKGTINGDFKVLKKWEKAWIFRGWGWNESGKWLRGKYLVKIYIDNEKVDEKEFFITSGKKAEYEVKDVRFFEAGYNPPDASERVYKESFPKYSSRYIWCELKVKNLKYKETDQSHKVEWVFYNPNGSIRGRTESDYNIKKEWLNSWIEGGWGWKNKGNWPKGKYKVKLYVDGFEISTRNFTIH